MEEAGPSHQEPTSLPNGVCVDCHLALDVP